MTDLEIANMALDRLGSKSITSFTDVNHQYAAQIGRFVAFYRDEILRLATWPAALKAAVLVDVDSLDWITLTAYAAGAHCLHGGNLYACITAGTSGATGPATLAADITDGTAHWQYLQSIPTNISDYAYRYPVPADCIRIKSVGAGADYKLKFQLIYSNTPDAEIVYVHRLDYDLFDSLMTDCLVLRLAGALAKTITGDARQDLLSEFSSISMVAVQAAKDEASERPQNPGFWTDADA